MKTPKVKLINFKAGKPYLDNQEISLSETYRSDNNTVGMTKCDCGKDQNE